MDRLRSPGGCPWDAAQTHRSLTPYLLEEAYEAVEAVEAGDRAALAEELGDVLLQVVFHARLAQEDPEAAVRHRRRRGRASWPSWSAATRTSSRCRMRDR